VRPWLTETTLKADLRSILRYTENILRTQAAFRTKLRGVTLPPAWAALLDQAFVKAPPKRVVNIDLAGAAALQRESDELRRRLLAAEEIDAKAANESEVAPSVPTPQLAPVVESSAPASPASPQIQRPADAPDGLLTDLSALTAIMGDANSEATVLLRALRAQQWQSKPATLPLTGNNQFVSLLFDRINERALAQLGDALLFIESDEWVVAEDYRDEIAYLLDHPDFTGKVAASEAVPVAAASASSNVAMPSAATVGEQADLIPSGWEECVRQMSPLGWATLAIVLAGAATGQDEVMSKLETLARSHVVTANQLLDQTNEVGLNSVGDNLIDVATTPPQVIEEYRDALTALVRWAQAHDQIEGLP
jgi:hypothetical protein